MPSPRPHISRPDPQDSWLHRPLAVVGMACRLPGAEDLDAFWELLSSGGYAVERMSDAKLDRATYFDPQKGVRGKTYSDVGGFVSEREWDWSVMPIDPSEASNWDECHLNLCEVAAKACQHAGFDPRNIPHRNAGVFVGHSGGSTLGGELAFRALSDDYVHLLEDLPGWASKADVDLVKRELLEKLTRERPSRSEGKPYVEASFAAGLISRTLGLTGPFMSIDAACASSLVALALGANALHSDQAEMVIVGGASYNKTDSLILFSNAQSCSATGSKPFDEDADGLISSEGYVTLVLKTLERAEADGDTIHAVIRGMGLSSDGRGRSLWAPRKEGQYEAISRAYSKDVRPDSVQLIEAHATSTQVGDATEMEALAAFYSEALPAGVKLPVGSVKSNIGHTLETAGLAGLVKSILAIQNETIPPTVNIKQLSSSIPWDKIPLYAARQAEPWPALPDGVPRRAAVNAFGIGGLNVHIVVEQYLPALANKQNAFAPRLVGKRNEPIAVVGRGLVVPGAHSVEEFAKQLADGSSHLVSPPADRMSAGGDFSSKLGYITEFEYEWRRHKVPPKQIKQANPLQFMLLDAAEQALREAGLLEKGLDRRHTAVVVGSTFGGDFGNALFAGLRLLEIRSHLSSILEQRGWQREQICRMIDEYESRFLKSYPALLDETGSFTSSTLASRLSKTFDLMGGAMALDAGDCSGLASLDTACGLLRSGAVSHVLCAAAQRALDRAALQNLSQLGRLSSSVGQDGYVVGEGVGLLVLKREADAIQNRDTIFATIDDVAVGFSGRAFSTEGLSQSVRAAAGRMAKARPELELTQFVGGTGSTAIDTSVDKGINEACKSGTPIRIQPSRNLKSTGHLQAAQGLVDIIAGSLTETGQSSIGVINHSTIGQCYLASMKSARSVQPAVAAESSHSVRSGLSIPANTTVTEKSRIFRFQASSFEAMANQLGVAKPSDGLRRFAATSDLRASVVCTPEELAAKTRLLGDQLQNQNAMQPLAEQGIFLHAGFSEAGSGTAASSKVAWMFPGQGSQYTGMLQTLVQESAVAASALGEANAALAEMGQPTFEEMAWSPNNQLGEDVWQTQASMLVADWILFRELVSTGHRPALVCGHSLGEFPAMLAAGCWTLSDALLAIWHRCQSITSQVTGSFAMLSVQASHERTQGAIDESGLRVEISHNNAPEQTVVGGQRNAIIQLAQWLEDESIASRVLPVPTAFHTSALEPARSVFYDALRSVRIEPPRLPLLSNITNRYAADPEAIRDGLARQLVSPLDFVGLIRRLVDDGVTTLVEVGPQQVLSRLVRQTDNRLTVIATDHSKRGAAHQLRCAEAVLELCDFDQTPELLSSLGIDSMGVADSRKPAQEPVHFDATVARKRRLRERGISPIVPATSTVSAAFPVFFDATDSRREARRRGAGTAASQPSRSETLKPGNTARDTATPRTLASPTKSSADGARVDASSASDPVASGKIESNGTINDAGSIEKFLIDFVVEQTGYPAEIVELDWDIEADLGIDSIKKAQLFGELREFFDLESHVALSLDSFRTLRDIVVLLESTPGKADWLVSAEVPPEATRAATSNADEVATASQSDQPKEKASESTTTGARSEELTKFLVDFVVEQTGYPPEIVELDVDLEADLGIDSIKKAQLLGEIREMFDLQVQADASKRGEINEYRTLRSILDVLLMSDPAAQSSSTSLTSSASESNDAATSGLEAVLDENGSRGNEPEDADPIVTSVSELPTAVLPTLLLGSDGSFGQGSDRDDGAEGTFVSAARRNLQKLASRHRTEDLRSAAPPSNGHLQTYSARTTAMANALGTPVECVNALDQALQRQASWRPQFFQEGVGRIHWLAALEIPDWMRSEHGDTIGALHDPKSDQVVLLTPGCVTSHAVLNAGRFLLVGGVEQASATSGDSVVGLCEFLRSSQSETIDDFVVELRGLKLADPWWVLFADAERGACLTASFEDGCLLVEKDALNVNATSSVSATSDDSDFAAMLGLDVAARRFVLRPRGGSAPGHTEGLLQLSSMSPTSAEEGIQAETTQARSTLERLDATVDAGLADVDLQRAVSSDVPTSVASRYLLRMVPAQARTAPGRQPQWCGRALIVGNNPVASQLEARLDSAGVEAIRLEGSTDPNFLASEFLQLSQNQPIPHLFITTPWDQDAEVGLNSESWPARRNKGILGNFWLCQKWLAHVIEQGLTDDASLIAVSSMGGDFGISGNLQSVEGGGLAGMLKAMVIESWTLGYRPLTIKVLDAAQSQSPSEIVGNIWQELAFPSYDMEISHSGGKRQVIRAFPRREIEPGRAVTPGGTWVCTGGARGITAYVAEEFGKRFGAKLHLLGKSPQPNFDPSWRDLDESGTRRLKAEVMTRARNEGKNPVKTWQDTEKSLEIDATMRRFASLGIEAYYHGCDVADRAEVSETLSKVREISGPIQGVLHGAGVGKDSRFDRKQPDKVDQCIAAKVDGAFSLMAATKNDPLEHFIGFGSISGRFGANGHTDYSLANEMLCKQIDWFAKQRPEVKCVGFHWHAWGDVGMATKPETRLALEMIDMQFMPAAEGIEHLVGEIQGGASDTEILITDDRYFRAFYPAETVVSDRGAGVDRLSDLSPLLDSKTDPVSGGTQAFVSTVDPCKDPFLTEHLLDGKPLMPFVVAAEMLVEAARVQLDVDRVELIDMEATGAIRFFGESKQDLRIESAVLEPDRVECQIYSDFRSRAGRLVESNRLNFRATAIGREQAAAGHTRVSLAKNPVWQRASYPPIDSKFYVGWPLQRMRKFTLVQDGIVGQIKAPALVELAGTNRSVLGWSVPSAAMDACLFTVGILAWQQVAPGSALPARIGSLSLGRLPNPGEACEVHAKLNSSWEGGASFDFSLYGVDGEALLDALDYEVAWLGMPVASERQASAAVSKRSRESDCD